MKRDLSFCFNIKMICIRMDFVKFIYDKSRLIKIILKKIDKNRSTEKTLILRICIILSYGFNQQFSIYHVQDFIFFYVC